MVEVGRSLTSVAEMGRDNADAADQIAANAEELADASQRLQEHIARFRT